MIRTIRLHGDPCLRLVARPLAPGESGDVSIRELLRDMRETLLDSGGVGLAAPQVGVPLRVFLAGSFPGPADPSRPTVPTRAFLNPRVLRRSADEEAAWEGCLSIPGVRVRVSRPRSVTVAFETEEGTETTVEAEGFFARVIQHELDHLDGVLTLDRASSDADVIRVE